MDKELGKITHVEFGLGGYQDCMIGIHFAFGGKGWGVSFTKSMWDPNKIEHSDNHRWTEEDRDKTFAEIKRYISDILHQSKVGSVSELKGIPVEIEFENGAIKDWRILTEVI